MEITFIFITTLVLILSGLILLLPISRRLGEVMEVWLKERQEGAGLTGEIKDLRSGLDEVRHRLDAVTDQQAFVEQLLKAEPERMRLRGPTESE